VTRAWLASLWLLLGAATAAHAGPALSLLVFGDSGRPVSWPERLLPQYRVGEAMAREDRRAPVQALLLLGDNFYRRGLIAETLEKRVRENLAAPYCYFLVLTQRGRDAFQDVCDLAPEQTHPVPFIAVLGNHDVGLNQGVTLQRHGIPRYVGNWLMPEQARSYELGGGVSLIAYDSPAIAHGGSTAALERALRESRGPWRILAAHHPIADSGEAWHADDAERVLAAIAAAGRPVQLFLAGHQHSLQVLRAPGAALHVISGAGGAPIRAIAPTRSERLFGEARYGFVRIDASPEALEVTLLALFGPFDRSAEPRARFRVTPAGAVEALDAKLRAPGGDPAAAPAPARR
jgi:Calcineurin-like phosphoesterase